MKRKHQISLLLLLVGITPWLAPMSEPRTEVNIQILRVDADTFDYCQDFGCSQYVTSTSTRILEGNSTRSILNILGLVAIVIGLIILTRGLRSHEQDWREKIGYEPRAGQDPDRGGGI